ncbi:putative carboxylic ester hydrolase DI49_4294 [Saccharomyces eubayanus]|uniref:putative carboxylic ester hydrolase n=1 Tax=Saccharomyces eubayanus TaxID=1080349 RepID=UPI0006C71124|nr:hypothetical protein DI49_4294 [Saccharomyces eubayanus]KOG97540.1 hypothetical protein DI49_4294 [Saccharomyces eubayanus]
MHVRGFLPNFLTVHQVVSENPIEFKPSDKVKNENKGITIPELIKREAPELADGATDTLYGLLVNGHLQTAYGSVRRFEKIDKVEYKRMVIKYPHGGEGTVDFAVKNTSIKKTKKKEKEYMPANQPMFDMNLKLKYSYYAPDDPKLKSADTKPMLILLHGLTGGSRESYVRAIVHEITTKYDFEACVFNARGCCFSAITTPLLYNGGWTNDIRYCINDLRKRFPNRKFYMMGFSLGASIMTNYLGEESDRTKIECAISMSNPFDLFHSSYFINNTPMGSHFYSPALGQNLLRMVRNHISVLEENPNFKTVLEQNLDKIRTVKQFDNLLTGPMFGYKNAEEYYRNASSYKRIPGIRTPFVAVHAMDDPIVGSDNLPIGPVKSNPYTLLIETSTGGHVGWFKDSSGKRWYTEPVCKFLKAFHDEITVKGLKPDLDKAKLPNPKCEPIATTFSSKAVQ